MQRRGSERSPTTVAGGKLFKVVVVGNANVGKSHLICRYISGERPEQTKVQATVAVAFHRKDMVIQLGKNDLAKPQQRLLKLSICDTAGQERYRAITTAHFKSAMGALIVFSVEDRTSFEKVPLWIESTTEGADPMCQIVIVGNKCDIRGDARKVSAEEGEQMASNHGLQYVEVSALEGINTDEAFNKLGELIFQQVAFLHDKLAQESLASEDENERPYASSASQSEDERFQFGLRAHSLGRIECCANRKRGGNCY